MTDSSFKKDLLKFGGINAITGNQLLKGNIRANGNGSAFRQMTVGQLTVTGNAVVPGITFNTLTVSGNVTSTSGNFIGNGALMTGVTSTLPTRANLDIRGNVAAAGNITAGGQVNVTGNVVGQFFIGNGSQLTGLLSGLPATANIDIRGNVTAPGNVSVAGQVNVIGNVVGRHFLGNVIGDFVNAAVHRVDDTFYLQLQANNSVLAFDSSDYLEYRRSLNKLDVNISGNTVATFDSQGNLNVLSNVIAPFFVGNGTQLTGITAFTLPPTANINIVGNVTAPGNVVVAGQVNVTGNVVGQYFIGNGALLSGIVTNLAGVANVDIRGNVTAPGNVVVAGQVNVTGNVAGNYFLGNGALLSGIVTNLAGVANVDIRGNVTAPGNVVVAGQVNILGNVVGQYFLGNVIGNTVTAQSLRLDSTAYYQLQANNAILAFDSNDYFEYYRPTNILALNIAANTIATFNSQGNLTVAGNVIAPFFVGNGSQLTGVTSTLPTRANLDIIGNVTAAGNVIVAGQVNVTGNVVANYFLGNGALLTGIEQYVLPGEITADLFGNVTATGNVSAEYFLGNGALLSGVAALNADGMIQQTNLDGYLTVPQGYVANTAVRLALGGGDLPVGSLVRQVDTGNSYLLTLQPSNVDANWLLFDGLNFPVSTVFGRVGDVLATYGDYLDEDIELTANIGPVPAGNAVSEALVYLYAQVQSLWAIIAP